MVKQSHYWVKMWQVFTIALITLLVWPGQKKDSMKTQLRLTFKEVYRTHRGKWRIIEKIIAFIKRERLSGKIPSSCICQYSNTRSRGGIWTHWRGVTFCTTRYNDTRRHQKSSADTYNYCLRPSWCLGGLWWCPSCMNIHCYILQEK